MKESKVLDGFFGTCVGDALGVPVEFSARAILKRTPVTDMLGNKSPHYQPVGTWSDDSSLMFCLAESLCHGFDLHDIADRICRWYHDGEWTPHGSAFDIGSTTRMAILRLKQGAKPTQAGGSDEFENGNGSLMRILPMAYYVQNIQDADTRFSMIHDVSAITHGHPRSKVACGIYVQFALHLLNGATPREAYRQTQSDIQAYYGSHPYSSELATFKQILREDIATSPEDNIASTPYVVHTLEAGLWCLLNNNSYRDTVLAAVNLGSDTDTTAAVAGGLAGIYYGFDTIPESWRNHIAKKDEIQALAKRFSACIPN